MGTREGCSSRKGIGSNPMLLSFVNGCKEDY